MEEVIIQGQNERRGIVNYVESLVWEQCPSKRKCVKVLWSEEIWGPGHGRKSGTYNVWKSRKGHGERRDRTAQ